MKRITLSLSDFTYTAPTAGTDSAVLSYQVPLGQYVQIPTDIPMNLRLTAAQVYSYTAAQTAANVTVTTTGTIASVANYYSTPSPAQSGLAYWTVSGSTTSTLLQANGLTANTLTFPVNDTTDTTASLVVFYLLANGYMKWRVGIPLSSGTYNADLFSTSILQVNQLNQVSTGNLLYFPRSITLAESFTLELVVNSSPAVNLVSNFTTSTPTYLSALSFTNNMATLNIPAYGGDISELNAVDANAVDNLINSYLRH